MTPNEMIVEVAYALPHEQLIVPIKVSQGTTTEQAIFALSLIHIFTTLA